MKVSMRPEPEEVHVCEQVFIFDSNSTPGLKHFVIQDMMMKLRCSCIGFNRTGNCWHIDRAEELYAE